MKFAVPRWARSTAAGYLKLSSPEMSAPNNLEGATGVEQYMRHRAARHRAGVFAAGALAVPCRSHLTLESEHFEARRYDDRLNIDAAW